MAKKPWNYDAIAMLRRPYWATVQDRTGSILKFEQIDPAMEPRHALVNLLHHWANDGWQLENFNSRDTHFYCSKGNERRFVGLIDSDPKLRQQITVQL